MTKSLMVLCLFVSLSSYGATSENIESTVEEEPVEKPIVKKSMSENVIDTSFKYGEKAYDVSKSALKKTNKALGKSQLNRRHNSHGLFINYSLFDTWIPSKYGLAYSLIASEASTWELDWNHSSMSLNAVIADLGKMSEDRVSLMWKSYSKRNSFYLSYGLNYYSFETYLGDKFISQVANAPSFSIDLLKISSIGVSFSLGNRWHFKNWVFGVDWFAVHVPVLILEAQSKYLDYATNENDKKTVNDTIDVLKHFPSITALKFQVGYSF